MIFQKNCKMVLGIPAIDQHDFTFNAVKYIFDNSSKMHDIKIVIFDNNSDKPYSLSDFNGFNTEKIFIIRNECNEGYYYPLLRLYDLFPSESIIGLVHNDLYIYEKKWDAYLMKEFDSNSDLGIVGFAGGRKINIHGGREDDFNFMDINLLLDESKRKTIKPCMAVDSLFMALRREVIPSLKINNTIMPCHAYDRIWSIRAILSGWKVAILGIWCHHIGGTTEHSDKFSKLAEEWCNTNNIPIQNKNPNITMCLEGDRRFREEFKSLYPAFIKDDFSVQWSAR